MAICRYGRRAMPQEIPHHRLQKPSHTTRGDVLWGTQDTHHLMDQKNPREAGAWESWEQGAEEPCEEGA
eukprot:gene17741-biopygen8534